MMKMNKSIEQPDPLATGGEKVEFKQISPANLEVKVPFKAAKRHPQFGSAQGLLEIADDFDDPLADFAEYATM